MDISNVFDHSVFENMKCTNYNEDLEQAHYHFVLGEIAYYVSQYGIDNVMTDIYDTLARECNAKVNQLEMEYHTYED